jgi:hypothetical protein
MPLVPDSSLLAPMVNFRQMAGGILQREGARNAIAWGVIYFAAALAVIIQGQFMSGIFHAEFAHFPDEPSHAMTAIFFRDYFTSLFPSPMPFARDYYLHYPKIAIGIWPPVFYVLAGTWLLIFGTSHASFLAFVAIMGAALGTALSLFVRRVAGPWLGLCSGVLLLCLRPLRFGTSTVMVDTTLTLACLLATTALIRYFKTERLRDALIFGILAAVAMLTKGNANELALVPVFMVIATGRYRLLRKKDLYLAGLVVLVVGVPWQILSIYMLNNAALISESGSGLEGKALGYLKVLFEQLGPVAILGTAVFMISVFFRTAGPAEPARDARAGEDEVHGIIPWFRAVTRNLHDYEIEIIGAGCLALAVYCFHAVAPLPGPDGRYMMGALPPLIFLFLAGVSCAARALGRRFSWTVYTAAALLLFVMPADAWMVTRHGHLGLDEAARILHDSPNPVILVDAEAVAEGGFILNLALLDHRPEHIVIRATKLLSDNPWTARVYRPRLTTPDEVKTILDQVPVNAVLLDLTRPGWQQDSSLLLEALRSDPDNWRLTNDLPSSPSSGDHLLIFRNVRPPNRNANDAQLRALIEEILSKKRR